MINKNAIVFLTRALPDINLINFCKELETDNLFVYICIDDFDIDATNVPVKIIQYNNDECKNKGFINSVLPRLLKYIWRPSAWDKALYHFCVKDTTYDYVHFVEDDVFITSKEVIYNLDEKYKNVDLLCRFNTNYDDSKKWYNWRHIDETMIKKPWYNSIMCAGRLSKRLLQLLLDYATINKKLLFHEIFFNTIAVHNNLKIENPIEYQNIYAEYNWNSSYFEYGLMYHPVKDISLHTKYRKILENKKDVKIMMPFKITMYDKSIINEYNKFELFRFFRRNNNTKTIKLIKQYIMSYNVNRFDNFITDIDENINGIINLIIKYSKHLKIVILIECPFTKIGIITDKLSSIYNFIQHINNSDNNTKILIL